MARNKDEAGSGEKLSPGSHCHTHKQGRNALSLYSGNQTDRLLLVMLVTVMMVMMVMMVMVMMVMVMVMMVVAMVMTMMVVAMVMVQEPFL